MDLLTNTALIGVVLGLITPLLTAVVQQPQWTRRTRQVVAVVCSTLVGLLTVAADGGLDGGIEKTTTVLAVIAAAQVAYTRLWRPTGIAPAVELVTSGRID